MSDHQTLTPSYDDFIEEYQPVQNHLVPDASFDGMMFETYGEELQYIQSQDQSKIFTIVDCDGCTFISSGFHYVNRMGYLIVTKSIPDNTFIEVQDDPECDPDAVYDDEDDEEEQ
ncbi:MAG: hypothetical protein OQK82_09350 [Candidatus Pacearchaeota archaeon]|nr:hypothetical protein [Candidatus Pacearchaeota archaeon]